MRTLGAIFPQLLADQRRDGAAFDRMLRHSNVALEAGDLAAAERLGRSAEEIMVRIRVRSKTMADMLTESENLVHNLPHGAEEVD